MTNFADPDGPQHHGFTQCRGDELGSEWGIPVWLEHELELGPWLEYSACEPSQTLQQHPATSANSSLYSREHELAPVGGAHNYQWATQCVSSHPHATS